MPFETLSAGMLAWVLSVIVLGGLIQGALGFGFPFVATPLLAMASEMRTAVIAVLLPTLAVTVINIANTASLRPVLARFWIHGARDPRRRHRR